MRLLLVDTQTLFLEGIKTLLSQEADLHIVGTANRSEEAIVQAQTLYPDLVILEAQMPLVNGKPVAQIIKQQLPDVKILIISNCEDSCCVSESLRAGAKGYLLKNMIAEELALVIRLVQRGHTLFAPQIFQKVLPEISAASNAKQAQLLVKQLTDRQREVFNLVGTGATNREIAQHLHIAEGTVKSYMNQLFTRFELKNRSQLAAYVHSMTYRSRSCPQTYHAA